MALAQLNSLAKTAIAGVPFNGSGEAARNVTASGVQGAFAFYAQAKPLADSGKVRALAIASPQRIATWPEVPTMQELGFANFDYGGFVGLAAPAKTPAPIIAYLNKALNEVVQSQDFKQPHGGARHDGAHGEHARRPRRLHAPRNQTPGRIGSPHRHQDDGAAAALTLLRRRADRRNG